VYLLPAKQKRKYMNTTNEIGYSPGQMLTIVSNALLQAKEAKTFRNNLIEATVSELGQAKLYIKECVKYNPMALAVVMGAEFSQYDCEFEDSRTIIMTPH
jgi:hypothetical protein